MRVIIAGGRDFQYTFSDLESFRVDLFSDTPNDEIEWVCGMAKGADQVAIDLYREGVGRKLYKFPAEWRDISGKDVIVAYSSTGEKYNKIAGTLRNTKMAEFAGKEGKLIAFWDLKSKGTGHMISEALRIGMKVRIIRYDNT
jgi:hypothetical protein